MPALREAVSPHSGVDGMLEPFTQEHAGERLRGGYGGRPATAVSATAVSPTAVLLHGAGSGSKERLLPLLDEFVAHGCRALAFDFSGHGESSGKLAELSLRRRFEQAVAVIDARVPADGPLVLVGFSMSGQTVADLARHYGERVMALGLCAPAVYAEEAWDLPFGRGDGRFSEVIRRPDSWRSSPALEVLRAYEGRAVLVVPGTDAVIPPAVTEAVQEALAFRSQFTRLELPEAEHRLGQWLHDHPADRRELVSALLTGLGDRGWTATEGWVAKRLPAGRSVVDSGFLSGGWSSQMRGLALDDGTELVLRSFVKPFFRHHAPGLLGREASVLALLAAVDGVPAPRLVAVDPTAEHCDHPSLLMSRLPGRVRVDEEDMEERLDLLAAQLVRIHRAVPEERPRTYQAWTGPERVRGVHGPLWERAVDVLRRDPPPYEGCFLHRDFHPGNVLFTGAGAGLRVSGVVDWVETSWGPADLDVAHCSTALALLHGPEHGLAFRQRYEAHGGRRLADGPDHLYWRLLDALAYCPDAAKLAGPWRELGRTELTPEVLSGRLEVYVRELVERYG
ncbi:pimeloyl-ACP methyl ester carboxylesterase/aminoglycoside phosphotransferase (APT) family kinase protein [Streptomyces sp. SAI-149]|nr:pimeloyl-ACP methyl ester carboxylesterase/aminoglycoside phosphotransferase (APT) family kinase protein [Streptomyces sp. SAI-119]MDH6499975.1 pimeloyl-ACP methyl ester carboxylesterase/aminoglycoside phosphotransferase (APT) family kinase protein [Streptomyces sp. SAI-149]